MRRLQPPTLAQWCCDYRWKVTTSRPGQGDRLRVRYLICRRCSLKVKTEERLAVPWDGADLVARAKAVMPEGEAVSLREYGIMELPLARINARLPPLGYIMHPSKGRDPKRLVVCTAEDGRVEQFGLFELRPTSPEAPPSTDRRRGKDRDQDHGRGHR